jgi:hypothetical protein
LLAVCCINDANSSLAAVEQKSIRAAVLGEWKKLMKLLLPALIAPTIF